MAALTAEKKKREKDEMAEFNEWKKMSWRRSRGKGRERDGPRDGSDGGDGGSSNSSEFDCPRALVDLDGPHSTARTSTAPGGGHGLGLTDSSPGSSLEGRMPKNH